MFSYDVKFITTDDSLYIKNSDFKSFKYETKKKLEESQYDRAKRNYCERRGGNWRSSKSRQLRQLETKLRDWSIVSSEWTSDSIITIVFSSGVIAYVSIKFNTLDVTQVLFDRHFIGKLSGQTVTGVVLCKKLLLFTHADKVATLVTFGKTVHDHLLCQISDRDPHIQTIELGGSPRRADRQVSCCENVNSVRILIWGATISEPAPWSPIIEDHANLHLYQINGHQINLIAYHQLENEVLFAELSHKLDHIIHITEQVACHKIGVNLSWLRYEIPNNDRVIKLSTLSENVTRVSLPAPARVARRSDCDTKLLIACIDASIHVVHHTVGLTHSTRAGFIATDVRWAGELVVAAEEAGRLQCFDRALSLLHHHTKCLDFTSYMRDSKRIQILATRSLKGGPLILATFAGGPLTLMRITHARLLSAWIRSNRTANAVALLRALDWEEEGVMCLHGMSEIVRNALRRGGLDETREVGVQMALGAYLAPSVPIPSSATKYAPAVHDLARKFFHHLLRRGRIEKALSLAVDLAAWDLFADARWAATRRQTPQLAEEAAASAKYYARLEAPDSECSDCSLCSSHSYTGSDKSDSFKIKSNPPPLPRVPLPQPSILTVPINQIDTYTTNSIRPNIHQYLDRDNTIWSQNIKDDTYLNSIQKREHLKPINSTNMRWRSVDNVLNLKRITTTTNHGALDNLIPRNQNERIASHFKHLYETELQETNEAATTGNFSRRYRQDYWPGIKPEKNKVKFSNTVTIAVVPDHSGPNPAHELAASLPLSPPHKYLAAFTPLPSAPAPPTPLPPAAPAPPASPAPTENAVQKPPKIKVVHFGMV